MNQLFIALCLLCLISCDSSRDKKSQNLAQNQFKVPEEPNWIQSPPSPLALEHKAIIINFWASWCGPCQEEMPSLFKYASENKDKVILLAVSGDKSEKEMKKFLKLYPLSKSENVYISFDMGRYWVLDYGVTGFPETLVFDRNKKKLQHFKGALDFKSQEFQELMLKAYQAN